MQLENTEIHTIIHPDELKLLRLQRDTYAMLLAQVIRNQHPELSACYEAGGNIAVCDGFIKECCKEDFGGVTL